MRDKVYICLLLASFLFACGNMAAKSDEESDAKVSDENASEQAENAESSEKEKKEDAEIKDSESFSCPPYKVLSKVKAPELDEISGLSRHSAKEDLFWVHNDSGSDEEIYLISKDGERIATYQLGGIKFNDPEDMTSMPCDGLFSAERCLVIADIGDNRLARSKKQLFIFKEPLEPFADKKISEIKTITLSFPFGERDGEAIFYDDASKKLIFVTKKRGSGIAKVYYADPKEASQEVKVISDFPVEGVSSVDLLITAAAKYGQTVILRNYKKVLFFDWKGIESGLSFKYSYSFSNEKQGEAIEFSADAKSFYTISEGSKPEIYEHQIAAIEYCRTK